MILLQKKATIPDPEREEERINIQHIFNDVTTALKLEIYKYNVNITTDFGTNEIKFARNTLRSIVYNLLSNAIKFRDGERKIDIHVSTENIEDSVLLKVQDSGHGIEKEHLESIFLKNTRFNN